MMFKAIASIGSAVPFMVWTRELMTEVNNQAAIKPYKALYLTFFSRSITDSTIRMSTALAKNV